MGSSPPVERPHAVMVPYPAQGHITPMLQLAKLLHTRGFHVTFVNNEFNHRRLLRSQGADALGSVPAFRFAAIADGLPPSDREATQDIPSLCYYTMTTSLPRLKELVAKLNEEAENSGGALPPVTCVVADSVMSFALRAARELGLRCATLWTASACGFMTYYHYKDLRDRGIIPLKDEAQLSNGYLDDTTIDWIPAVPKDLRLRDLPSFVRTTDPDDIMFNFFIHETAAMSQASGVLINTFDELDAPLLDAMSRLVPPIYTAGPLHLTVRNNVPDESPVATLASSLWKEQDAPLQWLDGRPPRSVVYVNFGSITVMSNEQLLEFAWGLANTGYAFLWNVRPDLVKGDQATLPPEFSSETEGRSMLSTWCPQAKVLEHEAVGVFLTHSGWNSTLESICGGVPMVCWPFFAEQQTNCRYKCTEWGIGMEIGDEVRRAQVEGVIREAMEGEKGREMRRRVMELRDSAVASARRDGRSIRNVDRLINEVLLA
ncbi:7-deoxyloganetin glucosyltransferase-like [Lolium rigidum]|uniref:7-deoxyloganetin glucosyltransferase-like n=1 Tax=Lolium rigidum TaxID=89674 RepID=UPI001F5DBF8A|nr:7-deoxyloganetin glucosyltransferase-like [Lolium rigidum]